MSSDNGRAVVVACLDAVGRPDRAAISTSGRRVLVTGRGGEVRAS